MQALQAVHGALMDMLSCLLEELAALTHAEVTAASGIRLGPLRLPPLARPATLSYLGGSRSAGSVGGAELGSAALGSGGGGGDAGAAGEAAAGDGTNALGQHASSLDESERRAMVTNLRDMDLLVLKDLLCHLKRLPADQALGLLQLGLCGPGSGFGTGPGLGPGPLVRAASAVSNFYVGRVGSSGGLPVEDRQAALQVLTNALVAAKAALDRRQAAVEAAAAAAANGVRMGHGAGAGQWPQGPWQQQQQQQNQYPHQQQQQQQQQHYHQQQHGQLPGARQASGAGAASNHLPNGAGAEAPGGVDGVGGEVSPAALGQAVNDHLVQPLEELVAMQFPCRRPAHMKTLPALPPAVCGVWGMGCRLCYKNVSCADSLPSGA